MTLERKYTNSLSKNAFENDFTKMGLLLDTWNCGLHMRQECRERFPATDFKGDR